MKKNLFNSVKLVKPKKSNFDLSHEYVTAMDAGMLVPALCMEAVPSDQFNLGGQLMCRMAPMVAPLMHRVDVSMHYFFVPSRLLRENFTNYITNTLVGGVLPSFPTVGYNSGYYGTYPLIDYFGLGDPGTNSYSVSALPFAAYQMIFNEYYRDQNLQTAVNFALNNGDNTANTDLYTLRNVCWEHDYFTASLPTAQKGTAVDIPIADIGFDPNGSPWTVRNVAGAAFPNADIGSDATGNLMDIGSTTDLTLAPEGTLSVQAATINELRRAYRLQEWLERAMLGGSRYVENILAYFGIRSQDARLQRPEYITGTRTTIGISEVVSSAETGALPQGNMAGHGIAFDNGNVGTYFCKEHGFIIGLAFIRPKTGYMQGVPKMWSKVSDPFEFFWPQFANIGEQAVKNSEVYAPHVSPDATFGYVPRYSEYKFMNNLATGEMKTTLDTWNWNRKFASSPALNSQFVQCVPDDRPFAVPSSGANFYLSAYHRINARRPMPYFGTPSI